MCHLLLLIIASLFSLHLPPSTLQPVFTSDPIPDSVFHRMQGRSYPAGCRIARSDLRYLRLSHYDAEGRQHVGEMVCNKAIAQDLIEIFRELYQHRYPIERIRLIDDYEAVDEQSMRDNNTSCFCYRTVSGTAKLSKHAQGLAVDVNTLYNPYVRKDKKGRRVVEPATAGRYADRSRTYKYKIERGDLLHRLFLQHGFKWGGDWRSVKDWQHFEK